MATLEWQPPAIPSPLSSQAANVAKRKPAESVSVSLPTSILNTPTYRPPTLTAHPHPSDITSLAAHDKLIHTWMLGVALVVGFAAIVL